MGGIFAGFVIISADDHGTDMVGKLQRFHDTGAARCPGGHDEHLTQRQQNILGDAEWWVVYPAEVECKNCKSDYVVAQGLKDITDTEIDDG